MEWVDGLDLTFNTKNIASQELPFPLSSPTQRGGASQSSETANAGRGQEKDKGGGISDANYTFCGSKNFFNLRKRVIFSITPVSLSVSIRWRINLNFSLAGEAEVPISNAI